MAKKYKMNILFLTIVNIRNVEERGIYPDLLRKFMEEGHKVYIISPAERREKEITHLNENPRVTVLRVRTLNLIKTNSVEKGVASLLVEYQYLFALKRYLAHVKFNLVLYSTPPITFISVIRYVKKRDKAYSYLLLKDIFPQNAIDLKMMKKDGALHKLFRIKEKESYKVSDAIGCMSQANVNYLLKHNKEINHSKVEINPNSINPVNRQATIIEKKGVRAKYKVPLDKMVFVYGGNLGKPQGVDFLLLSIKEITNENIFFLIIGTGTEFDKINKWFKKHEPRNALLLSGLPKDEYDQLLQSCDVGLIFLHKDFTIPNYPSRLLSYLEMKMPVIAATDNNTDIGSAIEKNNCGHWVQWGDIDTMKVVANKLAVNDNNFQNMRDNSLKLLNREFLVERSYSLIMNRVLDV